MSIWSDFDVRREQHADFLRAAERRRLIRAAQAGARPSRALYSLALAWVGRWLVVWGCRLQMRYSLPAGGALEQECGCAA